MERKKWKSKTPNQRKRIKWRKGGNRKRKIRQKLILRDGYKCNKCGCGPPAFLQIHHIIPLCDGGHLYDINNLELLCESCHTKQHQLIDLLHYMLIPKED